MALGLHQLQFPQWVSLVGPRGTNFFRVALNQKTKNYQSTRDSFLTFWKICSITEKHFSDWKVHDSQELNG